MRAKKAVLVFARHYKTLSASLAKLSVPFAHHCEQTTRQMR